MHITQQLAGQAVSQTLSGRNLNEVLSQLFRQTTELSAQQKAAIQDISFGVSRHLGFLQAPVRQLARQKPAKDLETLLWVALYQLTFSQAAPYAIVDHAVDLANQLSRGKAGGFINACLRRFLREQTTLGDQARQTAAGRWSHPDWWLRQLKAINPDHWQEILDINNSHPPMTLRVNRRQVTTAHYLQLLQEAGVAGAALDDSAIRLQTPVPVSQLPGFFDGLCSVQDWGAQQAAHLLDVHDGQRVLDACAAPGGKTGHLLELADLDLLAIEAEASRIGRIHENLQRLKLSATVKHGDAGAPEQWWDGQPFDRILADVPCSASGVVRRHPDIKWLRREEDLQQFAQQQARILRALWSCLKPGGKLLYATCSIFPLENSQQIATFQQHTPSATPIPLTFPGMVRGQLFPTHDHDGFYYALLEKSESA